MYKKNFQTLQKEYSQKSKNFDKALLKITLKESGEELVYLPELIQKCGLKLEVKDKKNALLRKLVAQNLIKTAQYFNNLGFTLKIESAYRSLDKQQKLFIERYLSMKMSFPNKPNIQLLRLANTYTAGIPLLAAHTAGAAVDVLLLNKDGKLLDFGVQYPYGNIESITGYPNLSKKVKENRMLLKNGMEKYGFINYPFEYWHYSIGDVCATYLTNKKYAMYGPVDYDLKNKKIVIQKLKTYLNTYFNISLD